MLVARQMGKTNLLINMKRERSADIVLYLDLSNRFDSVRAWFRHVIDSLIESYPAPFTTSSTLISEQRQSSVLEPNTEFDRHLRQLLRSTERRIIIVLDEIDSLVNAPYSDIILAQIRSMYFSRINYSEYERLTYVLSGVAEPSDLIKDKNISPFNIGEKIYLEDFSRAEFDQFLEKAGLHGDAEVADAIFSWASGNPRMTWDICSELEDRLLKGELATKETINEIVEKLYLRNYDRAPVDHIRTLVESDLQIRDAIISIHYGKVDYLDDKIKSRLYLSGITRTTSEGGVEIKNRIIDEALSERWLSQLSVNRVALLKQASKHFKEDNFEDAIKEFEQVFADTTVADLMPSHMHFEFSLSYFYVGNMERAEQEFEKCLQNVEDLSNRQNINYFLALTRMALGRYEQSLVLLKEAIEGPEREITLPAKLTLMQAYLRADLAKYGRDALACGYELIQILQGADEDISLSDLEYLVAAHHNIALAHAALGDSILADEELDRAMSKSKPAWKNALILRQYDLSRSDSVRQELALQASQVIIDNELNLADRKIESLRLNETRLTQSLYLLHKHGLSNEFEKLARYAASCIYKNEMTVIEMLLYLYEQNRDKEMRALFIALVEKAADWFQNDTTPVLKTKILRTLSLHSSGSKVNEWRLRFIDELVAQTAGDSIGEEDYEALSVLAFSWLRTGANQQLKRIFGLSEIAKRRAAKEANIWALYISYCEMEYQVKQGNKRRAGQIAGELVHLFDKVEPANSKEETNRMLAELRKRVITLLPREPIKHDRSKSYERNQKVKVQYDESEILEKKYKHIEKDLREGLCVIIEE